MSAITSYSKIPSPLSPLTNADGKIENIWHLFFSEVASGVLPNVYSVPVTGFTFQVPAGVRNVIFNPAGVLATGTTIMPQSAKDGQEIEFSTGQTITSMTFSPNAGQFIANAPTTLIAGQAVKFIFSQPASTWFKK